MNEYLNTLRRLEDKPLLIESRWCLFGIHKWLKWSDARKELEFNFMQARACIYCNKIQMRKIANRLDIT
jgi:hypothetical protein